MSSNELEVAEGVSSVYCYHLRHAGQHRSLCDLTITMNKLRPLSAWKTDYSPSHIPIKYCDVCDRIFKGMR